MSARQIRYSGMAGLIVMLLIIAACGGTSSSSTAGGISPTAAPSFTVTPTPVTASATPAQAVATPTATAVASGQVGNSGPDEPSDEEILARGRLIFEKTAGGVGCAMCHGMDALGDPAQGTPPNIGATAEFIEQALFDRPQMSFISITRDEVNAVAAYLQWLKEQQ